MYQTKHNIKQLLIESDGQLCFYCGDKLRYKQITLDHVFPRSKGQTTSSKIYSTRNCVLSCFDCNIIKGSRLIEIEEFRKERMGPLYKQSGPAFSKRRKLYNRRRKGHHGGSVYAKNPVFPTTVAIIRRQNIFQKWISCLKNKISYKNKLTYFKIKF